MRPTFFSPFLFLILSGNWSRLISIGKVVMDLYSLPIWVVYKDIHRALPIKLSPDRTWTSFNFFNEPAICKNKTKQKTTKMKLSNGWTQGVKPKLLVLSNSIADGLRIDFMHSRCLEMLWTKSIVLNSNYFI